MKIFLFASLYPEAFKPYYDAQFADLLEAGHDVTLFAWSAGTRPYARKVLERGLLERTRYLPGTPAEVPRYLPAVAATVLRHPRSAAGRIASAGADGFKQRVLGAVRALCAGPDVPDVCLLHGLATATQWRWLRAAYPSARLAMYYHGGEVPGNRTIPIERATDTFTGVDHVFTNTAFSRDQAIARGCPPDRIHILPVGFDLRDFEPPEPRRYRASGHLRLFSAGRLSEEKGFTYAIEAVRMLRDRGCHIDYTIAGSGYLHNRLQAQIRDLHLADRVHLAGALPADAIVRELGRADALVLPSIPLGNWAETQACTVQEAMLMQAVAVTTRTGGVPECIPAALQPWCVPPADPVALADAIAQLDRLSRPELETLGIVGRNYVVAHYGVRAFNRRILKILSDTHPHSGLTPVAPA